MTDLKDIENRLAKAKQVSAQEQLKLKELKKIITLQESAAIDAKEVIIKIEDELYEHNFTRVMPITDEDVKMAEIAAFRIKMPELMERLNEEESRRIQIEQEKDFADFKQKVDTIRKGNDNGQSEFVFRI